MDLVRPGIRSVKITPDRFLQGMTYPEYKAQMRYFQAEMQDAEGKVDLRAEDVRYFSRLPTPLHVLVFTEDWCGAALESVPVLARLAEESRKLDLRFFLRDQNLDIMDLYLKDGIHRSIPTFIFFEDSFQEVARWFERAAKIEELMTSMEGELYAHDPVLRGVSPETPWQELPEAARQRLELFDEQFWQDHRQLSDLEVVREIREAVESGLRSLQQRS